MKYYVHTPKLTAPTEFALTIFVFQLEVKTVSSMKDNTHEQL